MGEPLNLYTAPSNIIDQNGNSIGLGLYSLTDIRRGEKIAEYKGILIETSAAKHKKYISDYVFEINSKWSIDAKDYPKSFARFCNDPVNPKLVNAELLPEEGLRVFLFAKKDIEAGDEIFVSYGPEYWCDTFHLERVNGDGQHILARRYPEVRAFIRKHYHT